MAQFCLNNSSEYYLQLSENPKRFDANSPINNVFFDDTNGEVITVRSGGVTGVMVTGMDDSNSTSFRMEDKGPIISIKFSPDHKILAIQRNKDNQNATVEFQNELGATNAEYSHTCKWKNAKILDFVWTKVNEIAFITDHGIELLQVVPDKKQLKSLKNTSFSGAWFSWCSESKIVLLSSNNGALLQPFSLNNSTIIRLNKLEVETPRPLAERDVFCVRSAGHVWCAVFRHTGHTVAAGPTEVLLLPVRGSNMTQNHVLKTGLVGRFAVNVVDDLIVVHHQSSQTSLLFDIMEECKCENNSLIHTPIVAGKSMKPAFVEDQPCRMYSDNWAVFQPDYMIDAILGCLWKVKLEPSGLVNCIPKEDIPRLVAVLLRRSDGRDTLYQVLNQLVANAADYLVELGRVFDELNVTYRRSPSGAPSQTDVTLILGTHADGEYVVQVVTAYIASLCRNEITVQHNIAEFCVRTLLTKGAGARLRALVRRGCLADSRPLACALLSLAHLQPAAAQLALDMMSRVGGCVEIVEVLLSWNEPITAVGVAKQSASVWANLPPRKILAAAALKAKEGDPGAFVAIYNALMVRNEELRGVPQFTKGEQCDSYVELYKKLTCDI